MKVATISGVVIAALAAGAIATPSLAQPYGYDRDCRSNAAAGTILGGIAGAVLGSNLAAHHGGRSGGAAIGGVAGALLGNSIGRSSSSCDYRGYSSGYYAQPGYAYAEPAYVYARPAYSYGYEARYDRDRYRGHDRDDWHARVR